MRAGFELYQSCWACLGCGGEGERFGPGSGRVWWYYVYVSCESGSFV